MVEKKKSEDLNGVKKRIIKKIIYIYTHKINTGNIKVAFYPSVLDMVTTVLCS